MYLAKGQELRLLFVMLPRVKMFLSPPVEWS